MIDGEDFQKFLNKFKARYGEYRMNDETSELWYEKLHNMDNDQFVAVTDELIGSRDRVFGWKVVSEKCELMFPEECEQVILEKEWKSLPNYAVNQDKKKHMTAFMNDLITDIKDGKGDGWIKKCADEFVKKWGRSEAQKQIRAMEKDTDESKQFCLAVSRILN